VIKYLDELFDGLMELDMQRQYANFPRTKVSYNFCVSIIFMDKSVFLASIFFNHFPFTFFGHLWFAYLMYLVNAHSSSDEQLSQ